MKKFILLLVFVFVSSVAMSQENDNMSFTETRYVECIHNFAICNFVNGSSNISFLSKFDCDTLFGDAVITMTIDPINLTCTIMFLIERKIVFTKKLNNVACILLRDENCMMIYEVENDKIKNRNEFIMTMGTTKNELQLTEHIVFFNNKFLTLYDIEKLNSILVEKIEI